jgi:hypothetical protein
VAQHDVAAAYKREMFYRDLARPSHCEGREVRTKPDKPARSLDTKILTTTTNQQLPNLQPIKYLDDLEDGDL